MLANDDFYRMAKAPDGLQYNCKTCCKELQAEAARRRGVPAKRIRNPDLLLVGMKECFMCDLVLPLSSFTKTPRGYGGLMAYCKPCCSKRKMVDPKLHAMRTRNYRRGNLSYRSAHAAHMSARRARIRNQDTGLVTIAFVRSLYDQDQCSYCCMSVERSDRTMDHCVPLVRGGLHDPANLVMACSRCNSRKGAKTSEEYRLCLTT